MSNTVVIGVLVFLGGIFCAIDDTRISYPLELYFFGFETNYECYSMKRTVVARFVSYFALDFYIE